jgi:hypothetical protein
MKEYEIKEACMKAFLSKDTFNTLLKYAAPILTAFMAATITYGFANARTNEKQDQRILITENTQHHLDSLISAKLDTLIQRRK